MDHVLAWRRHLAGHPHSVGYPAGERGQRGHQGDPAAHRGEDTATQAGEKRPAKATSPLLAPMSYFRSHLTGNIHGRLNRSLKVRQKLIKLMFMDFAPAVTTGLAAIVTIFTQLPLGGLPGDPGDPGGGPASCSGRSAPRRGSGWSLMEADMDDMMVELLGGIETIRALIAPQSKESDGARSSSCGKGDAPSSKGHGHLRLP